MMVRMREDDKRFKLKKNDLLEVTRYWLDPQKLTVIQRVSDGYDPQCNVYTSQVRFPSNRTIACPHCKIPKGQRCRVLKKDGTHGSYSRMVHRARVTESMERGIPDPVI